MKKIFTSLLGLLFLNLGFLNAQGLEKIIVEKFYVSDENDAMISEDEGGGTLNVGSKTYRIYVDMVPDYVFQAAYGEEISNDTLFVKTTTTFFNNEDRGESFANGIGCNRLEDNTVMLDSWLSVGAACDDGLGVLKSHDDGVNTIVNGDGALMNTDSCIGILLTEQDGQVSGTSESVTTIGISAGLDAYFNNSNTTPAPHIFSTDNGAWSSLNGSSGVDPDSNIVLIGQFTTDGDFCFRLNIQLRNNSTGDVEKWVAIEPGTDQFTHESLTFCDTLFVPEDTIDTAIIILENSSAPIKVFPNPATDHLSVQISSAILTEGEFEIYSVTGERIKYGSIDSFNYQNSRSDIDISNLMGGMYLIKFTMGDQTYIKKFVKE